MATIKSYTSLEKSRKLAEILPPESADMYWWYSGKRYYIEAIDDGDFNEEGDIRAWSLAALLEYMNRNFYNISLNYCGSEYTISFDDGERYKTITKDYSIDAAVEMIVWLKENNRI